MIYDRTIKIVVKGILELFVFLNSLCSKEQKKNYPKYIKTYSTYLSLFLTEQITIPFKLVKIC